MRKFGALRICKHHHGRIDILVTDLVLRPRILFAPVNEFPHVLVTTRSPRLTDERNLRIVLMSVTSIRYSPATDPERIRRLYLEAFENQEMIDLVRRTLQEPPATQESLMKEATARAKKADEWFD